MRAKMDRAERAKQFMPFAALEGLDRTLFDFNRPEDERVCLGEDAQIELDRRLHTLCPGREVCAVYYANRQYTALSGTVMKIDLTGRSLLIDDTWVALDDILDLQAL